MSFEILDQPSDDTGTSEIYPVNAIIRLANFGIDFIVFFNVIGVFQFVLRLPGLKWILLFYPILLFGVFMAIQEYLLKGRSIGKFITGTKVVDENGNIPDSTTLFKRNLLRAVPFEPFSFISDGRGWHDQWTDTYVVKI